MVNLVKRKFDILFNPKIVFIFLLALVFVLYKDLLQYYFEADEWFHFTYYLPLTKQPDGFITALVSTIINAGPLSGGQHVVPVASVIYFLNTKFFGLNYFPYAFMSLLLHAINSFLVFLLMRALLYKKPNFAKNVLPAGRQIFAFLGAIFFALAPTPMHTITGATPFYGQNILSVTFFLLCILFFKLAFVRRKANFVYFSILFLFLSLFTKETSVFLFALLPIMALMEKRTFPLKFLGKLFLISVLIYSIFRFLVPNIYNLPGKLIDKWVGNYISSLSQYQAPVNKNQDTRTIVSRDLSIHKNLPAEILFRAITFPIKMTGTLFLPRQTVFSIVEFITPIVQPVPPGGDSADSSQARLTFLYGPGNGFIIYIASLVILIFCTGQIFRFVRRRQIQESRTLATGLAIIILSSMPLVAIIFSFPRWGYDFYFDSRFYYNPTVGAAIVFPFLLFGLARFFSRLFRVRSVSLVVLVLFIVWLINNMYIFNLTRNQFIHKYGSDRREVVNQLKNYLPSLKQKTVFYMETDGKSAFGPVLPFYTSVSQALTVIYYDKSPLPDSFLDKALFDGKPQGYMYSEGRGFGFYTSKKDLSDALLSKNFSVDDIYGFYYYAEKVKLKNITEELRKEITQIPTK